MFLFVPDTGLLSAQYARLAGARQLPGELREIRANGAAVLWTADGFTEVDRNAGGVAVRMRRPQVDKEPVCAVCWRPGEEGVVCRRRWSGEFSAYVNESNATIASHLKLAALLRSRPSRAWKRIEPGHEVRIWAGGIRIARRRSWSAAFEMDYAETVREVRRLILESVVQASGPAALLLSGGIDSSAVAVAMRLAGKEVHAFTFGLDRLTHPQTEAESDLICARKVAAHLGIRLQEIALNPRLLIRNVPLGIYLAETSRGTIVDDCVALVEVARRLAAAGYSQVWMGEAADDLFGGFKFALRYYRGAHLRAYYRAQLTRDLPNELAIIQNVFGWFGIAVVQPMWTEALLRIGYNLPLAFRLDGRRLMKRVLRDAFAAELPPEIANRPKCATRDGTQIRNVLEREFGAGRDRYRALFRTIMGERARWPRKLSQVLKTCGT
jgi:asparagine synthase (glutamine-hydrolysing)